ncbi:hypothetical protein SDC9_132907 [bioreactor metagenome]|uniref:Uncharacterized protein n=1 Tax=bioreactor metagenome TaxID=1076179 RepID=A0A645D9E2_9ZZZZ
MRKYLTSLMILFTLLLALGGMYLPSLLLDRQQAAVMEESGIVDAPSANKAEEAPGNTTQGQDSPTTEETMLTSEEIFTISKSYNQDTDWLFCDPTAGQLSSDEAIDRAIETVKGFCEQGILPESYANVSSLDRKVVQGTKAFAQPSELDAAPKLGCWIITFGTKVKEGSLELYLNAVTGQILQVSATYSSDLSNDLGDVSAILDKYLDYLGIDGKMNASSHWSDDSVAGYYFKDFQSGIVVKQIKNESNGDQDLIIRIS